MAFMYTTLASSYPLTNNQLETLSNPMNQVDMQGPQTKSYVGNFSNGNDHIARQCTQPTKVHDSAWFKEKMLLAQAQEAGIALNGIDLYDLDCDDISTAKAVLMANLSSYGSDVLSEVPHSETYQNDMANQIIMEYLVNISKRRAFWSLNEDILKITVLTTNTPYPSRKIRRICACTHQRPRRKHDQYAVSREDQYAVLKI
ncbi:hypothetical protein Tco_0780727 [Tanacetum coccineum]